MLMTDLDPKLTFDSFVVGPANRLASAAAKRSADAPGTSYNPLFIYASSGLGKTHILSAVAHHAQKANARLRVTYQTLEGYLGELEKALETGSRDAMRDRYRDLDILLLDDVQFLAGQPEAQEMLLGSLDSLTASGSQIVLASDRPPAEINGLDSRLVSRFSGGLIVDIASPEYETRVAIIRKKADEGGQKLAAGVAEALARFPARNIRELGGALNKVFAVQDLEDRQVTPDEVARMLGQAPAQTEAAVQPAAPAPGRTAADEFASFMDELSASLATTVEKQEEEWRKLFRTTAEAAEREGFNASRLRSLMEGKEPAGWEQTASKFSADLARLREIEAELDRLGNPWPEAAQGVVREPDKLAEAEALLQSVRERMHPFRVLAPGAKLADLRGFPTIALKAADQLIGPDKPKYNPIYLWSRDPRAAQSVLAGAGRSFKVANARVAVTSVAEFAEDFIRALSAGVAGAWRERWWTVDLLLVHETEGLSGTERAQDEFFHLFEALKRRGSRVLFAANRPPAEIEGIDERLRSRFEGGLVLEVDTQAPLERNPVVLVDAAAAPAQPTEQDIWAGTGKEKEAPAVAPLDQLVGESGMIMAKQEKKAPAPPPAPEAPGRSWIASGEKVVWNWPALEDRLVEDFE
jgi:chromosomal replication initiation ATPase DnaA